MIINKENLDKYLEPKVLCAHPDIKALVNSALTLGFTIDCIRQAFRKLFLDKLQSGLSELNLESMKLSTFVDNDQFVEACVLYTESISSSSNSNDLTNGTTATDDYYADVNDNVSVDGTDSLSDEILQKFNKMSTVTNGGGSSSVQRSKMNTSPTNSSTLTNSSNGTSGMLVGHMQLPLSPQQQLNNKLKSKQVQELMSQMNDKSNLRPIIVDGNDVGLSVNPNKQVFSFARIVKVVDFFENRNHQIFVILPQWRKDQIMNSNGNSNGQSATETNGTSASSLSTSPTNTTSTTTSTTLTSASSSSNTTTSSLNEEQLKLLEMEKKGQLHYTPSRRTGAKRIICDDDVVILKLAVKQKGIIVSNDNFKRFLNASDEYKRIVDENVLMYSFIDEDFFPVDDPLGKNGPRLDNFLRFKCVPNEQYMKICPYKKKCTYGTKCKFFHPERQNGVGVPQFKTAHQSVIDMAKEQRLRLEIILNDASSLGGLTLTDDALSSSRQQQQQHQQQSSSFLLGHVGQVSPPVGSKTTTNTTSRITTKPPPGVTSNFASSFNSAANKDLISRMGVESAAAAVVSSSSSSTVKSKLSSIDWPMSLGYSPFSESSLQTGLDSFSNNNNNNHSLLSHLSTANTFNDIAPKFQLSMPSLNVSKFSTTTTTTTNNTNNNNHQNSSSFANSASLLANVHLNLMNSSEQHHNLQQSLSTLKKAQSSLESVSDSMSSSSSLNRPTLDSDEQLREKLLRVYTRDQVNELMNKYTEIKDFETLDLLGNSMFLFDKN